MVDHEPEPKRFEPKNPVVLDPPKNDPITLEELSKCDGTWQRFYMTYISFSHNTFNADFSPGTDPDRPTLVAIKGTVFDVSKNAAYAPSGQYHGTTLSPAVRS
jgi:predicted heme/steroid binding protein